MLFKSTSLVFILAFIFFISLTHILAQPGNDNPCGAIVLSVVTGSSCTPSGAYSWTDATATPGFPNPGCADYKTGDIWFRFTINQPSDIFITSLEGTGTDAITDGGMALYFNDQNCTDAFYFLDCDDDAGAANMPQLQLSAQAAGTYYIRFWDYNDQTSGNISGICIAANPVLANNMIDDPCEAVQLNVVNGESCTPSVPVSWINATATAGFDLPGCGSYTTGDVWFSFVLTDTSDISISTTEGSGVGAITDGAFTVYSADACDGTFAEIYCADDQGAELMPKLDVASQLPGKYFIRFLDNDDQRSGNIGGICVAAQPVILFQGQNDDPCNAIELIVVSDTTCMPDHPIFWTNATATAGIEDPPCASYTTGDVWFKFTLTEASDITIRTVEGTGPNTFKDAAMALYKANACDGPFYFIFCDDDAGPGTMPQIEQLAMPAGDYLIRVWDYADGVTGNIGGICVSALPTISTSPNDICITALPFPDIPVDGNCASVSVNTEGATGSLVDVCDGKPDDDVWYSFIVPTGISKISYQISANGEPDSQVIQLFRGTCDDQFAVGCFTGDQGIFPDLTPGQIYFIRTFTSGESVSAQYDICLQVLMSPPNDDPCGAITLIPVNNANDCTPDDPVAWAFASASNIASDPGCGSYTTGDVWYKFDITYKADLVIRTSAGSGNYAITDGAMALYRKVSDCNQLDLIGCNDDATTSDKMPEIIDFALPPGSYYIRLWDHDDKISGNIGGICVALTPTISTKVNDQCEDALSFPVIPTDGTCASVEVNTAGATGSINAPLPGFNDDDLWYYFVVPPGANRLLYEITTNSGNTQHVICLYDGCGSHASYLCSDVPSESGEFSNLVEGFGYLLNVYTADIDVSSDFNICLKTPPPPPSNDECSGAISFPAIPMDGSCSTVSIDTKWATTSGIFGCGNPEKDLWYSFVVPDGVTELLADFSSESRSQLEGFELFDGDCLNLSSKYCVSDYRVQSLRIRNLVPGQTYFLRVFTGDQKSFAFNMCLKIPPTPPVNDLCPGALAFPDIPTDGSCATLIANTVGATGTLIASNAFIYDDEVWFSFVIPSGQSGIIVKTTPITLNVLVGVVLYEGDCDHLTFIGNQTGQPAAFYGLSEGETYYLKAYTLSANQEATFEICLAVPPSSPDNDDCDGAQAFAVIPINGDWISVEGSTLSGTDSGLKACIGYADDDVWLSFVVPFGHDRVLFRHNDDADLVLELYEGDCSNLTFLDCFGSTNGSDVFMDLVEGDTYFIRVYNSTPYEYSSYKVELSLPQPINNDFCDQAFPFGTLQEESVLCLQITSHTTLFSTSDIDACIGNTDDDAWFSFQLPAGHTSALFKLQPNLGGKLGMQVFGGDCNNLILQECFDTPGIDDISGLESGQTYWIQIYTLDDNAAAEFSLCLSAGPLQPDNDDCANATCITSYPGYFVDPGTQSTEGATNSGVKLCYPYDGKTPEYAYDVWYSFVTDYTGGDATITIHFKEPDPETYEYMHFHLQGFEGQCGDLATLTCLENDPEIIGQNDSTLVMNLYGLSADTKYYFRVVPTSDSRNYAPVDFTVFAEGTALEGITAIEDHGAGHQGLQITRFYPSPAHNVLHIDYSADAQVKAQLYVTDLLGHVIQQKELLARQGENHETLLFDQVPSGLYIIYIENEKIRSQPERFVLE